MPWRSCLDKAHPEASFHALMQRDAARSFSDPGLRAGLIERYQRDQAARNAMLAAPGNAALQQQVMRIDAENVVWLNRLVRRQGFPTVAQAGELGVHNAWLLAQHADTQPAFQAALLPALEQRHADGELDGTTLSRFVDRVLVAQGKPQRYGSHFPPEDWATGHFVYPDEPRMVEIEANRRALGIMPLADYVCMMRRDPNATS